MSPLGPEVSIHAPAWGATFCLQLAPDLFAVSIHAPAWGATRAAEGAGLGAAGFNPRTRVGCDATSTTWCRPWWRSFNPRTRVGCDEIRQVAPEYGNVSIHAPAWGATFRPPVRIHLHLSFNPRTRVGCDAVLWQQHLGYFEFQSTHPRGVRRTTSPCRWRRSSCFNPRTRVGCDPWR